MLNFFAPYTYSTVGILLVFWIVEALSSSGMEIGGRGWKNNFELGRCTLHDNFVINLCNAFLLWMIQLKKLLEKNSTYYFYYLRTYGIILSGRKT
jgi:hypothetical protein